MKPMTYKGYAARIEYSDEDGCFVGRILGIRDIITFDGESVKEVRKMFQAALDFYLETCARRGESPDKPHSGKLMLRVSPSVHASVALAAESSGKSINQWAGEVLDEAARSQ